MFFQGKKNKISKSNSQKASELLTDRWYSVFDRSITIPVNEVLRVWVTLLNGVEYELHAKYLGEEEGWDFPSGLKIHILTVEAFQRIDKPNLHKIRSPQSQPNDNHEHSETEPKITIELTENKLNQRNININKNAISDDKSSNKNLNDYNNLPDNHINKVEQELEYSKDLNTQNNNKNNLNNTWENEVLNDNWKLSEIDKENKKNKDNNIKDSNILQENKLYESKGEDEVNSSFKLNNNNINQNFNQNFRNQNIDYDNQVYDNLSNVSIEETNFYENNQTYNDTSVDKNDIKVKNDDMIYNSQGYNTKRDLTVSEVKNDEELHNNQTNDTNTNKNNINKNNINNLNPLKLEEDENFKDFIKSEKENIQKENIQDNIQKDTELGDGNLENPIVAVSSLISDLNGYENNSEKGGKTFRNDLKIVNRSDNTIVDEIVDEIDNRINDEINDEINDGANKNDTVERKIQRAIKLSILGKPMDLLNYQPEAQLQQFVVYPELRIEYKLSSKYKIDIYKKTGEILKLESEIIVLNEEQIRNLSATVRDALLWIWAEHGDITVKVPEQDVVPNLEYIENVLINFGKQIKITRNRDINYIYNWLVNFNYEPGKGDIFVYISQLNYFQKIIYKYGDLYLQKLLKERRDVLENEYIKIRSIWIEKNGSEYLKYLLKNQYPVERIYAEERLNKDFPGFSLFNETNEWIKKELPSEEEVNIASRFPSGVIIEKIRRNALNHNEFETESFILLNDFLGQYPIIIPMTKALEFIEQRNKNKLNFQKESMNYSQENYLSYQQNKEENNIPPYEPELVPLNIPQVRREEPKTELTQIFPQEEELKKKFYIQ